MANICEFKMKVKGERENIQGFFNALIREDRLGIGTGANAALNFIDDKDAAFIDGDCSWSIITALVDDAYKMQKDPKGWYRTRENEETLTLFEACKRFNLKMEVYSLEPGMCFQEHFLFDKWLQVSACTDYHEYYLGDYKSKEEAEAELDTTITDEEWENEYVGLGGFKWYFSI